MEDDTTLDENNVEFFIQKAIKSYFDKNLLSDGMFWREAIRLLAKKHGIIDEYNRNLKQQRKDQNVVD